MNEENIERSEEQRLHALLCAVLLGEASEAERAEVERELERSPELRAERERILETIELVGSLRGEGGGETLSAGASAALADAARRAQGSAGGAIPSSTGPWHSSPVLRIAAAVTLVVGGFALMRGGGESGPADTTTATALPASKASEEVGDRLEANQRAGLAGAPSSGPVDAPAEGAASAPDASAEGRSSLAQEAGGSGGAEALRKNEGEQGLASEPEAVALDFAGGERTARFGKAEEAMEQDVRARVQNELSADPLGQPVLGADFDAAEKLLKDKFGEAGQGGGGAYKGAGDSVPIGEHRLDELAAVTGQLEGGKKEAERGVLLVETPQVPATESLGVHSRTAPGSPAGPGAPSAGGGAGPSTPGPRTTAGVELKAMTATRYRARSKQPLRDGAVATGADEFFLGRGEADAGRSYGDDEEVALRVLGYLADAEDSPFDNDALGGEDRRAGRAGFSLNSPDDLERRAQWILRTCRRLPSESPRDMFFRFWGDNPFEYAALDGLSTFSIDVDTASYTLARRYLNAGNLPEKVQVRTEEFVNYFKGDVPAPLEETFAVLTELAPGLFSDSPDTWMMRVAVRGKEIAKDQREPLALTFVVDVSGSMKENNRLELVKHSLRLLLTQLDLRDSISIVAFSNEARLVLPMTSARHKDLIESAIHQLQPNGGTNAEAGLKMGYAQAEAFLARQATNRVVFLSDGVANIGQTDQDRLNADVARFRSSGIYLNTIGVGMNNHNDVFLEQLANKGDGLCNYVDDAKEARRALVENFTGAFQPIARDVKIQVEFDPVQVERYRLLGYENRAIADADFRNDAVDAGEVGSGHQVVALYEVVRAHRASEKPLATVRLRWKAPHRAGEKNLESEQAVERAWPVGTASELPSFAAASAGYRRSVLVGQFAEFLRRSVHARGDSLDRLMAESAKLANELKDPEFDEFVTLVKKSHELVSKALRRAEERRVIDELYLHCYLGHQIHDLERLHVEGAQLEVLERQLRELEARIESMSRRIDEKLLKELRLENERMQRRLQELLRESGR